MKWLLNLSLKKKFGFLLTVITFAAFIGILFSANNYWKIESKEELLLKKNEVQKISFEAIVNLDKIDEEITSIKSSKSNTAVYSLENEINEFKDNLSEYINRAEGSLSAVKNGQSLLLKLSEDTGEFYQKRMVEINLMKTGNYDAAISSSGKTLHSDIQQINKSIHSINALLMMDGESYLEESLNISDTAVKQMYFFGILILFACILLFMLMNKFIIQPIVDFTKIAEGISKGNFSDKVQVFHQNDEIGQLSGSFAKMIESLNETAKAANEIAKGNLTIKISPKSDYDEATISLNQMLDNLQNMTFSIKEDVNSLTSSASEVSATIAQLSSSISETASSISETTATVEEVKTTSEISSQKSREAVEKSDKVMEIAEEGKNSITEGREGIGVVKNQIDVIGQNMVQLTEHSKAIGDIISSVSDIAEQSNLLAVNASIEAARAGEQGKSFVVVAQEIKSLSDQSKQATAKVKTLLNDIQNSINSAVMATEKGEKVVREQVTKADFSENAIEELADALNSVRDVVMQTSLTSQEQSVGMDQIAEAMENIKVASIQNSNGTQELQEAASIIKDIADSLTEIISKYKV